ncbi:MAG: TetR/AcrR family transcriptional regulator [Geminicoccaceae bacterium]|nr:TetR/AcrR family transcriptional regulator [Geminicoccaceae bacterium]
MAQRKKPEESKPASPDLLDVAFGVIGEMGLRDDVARQVADRAGTSLSEVYRQFPTENALIGALSRRVDERMLETDPLELEALPPRDRVFELMMSRFEALQPYRPGLRRLARGARGDPLLLLTTACRLERSLIWLQAAAGLPARGLRAQLARRMLTLVYIRAMRVWFDEEGLDMAKTMAGLDRDLRRMEGLAGLAERPGRERPSAPEPAGEPA